MTNILEDIVIFTWAPYFSNFDFSENRPHIVTIVVNKLEQQCLVVLLA